MPTLQVNSGSYTIIGAASVTSWMLGCAVGVYALTGTVAGTVYGHPITALSGSYAITGTAIQTNRIAAEPAGYLIHGQDAGLEVFSNIVVAVSGAYAVTGSTAILEKAIVYNRGVYTVAGTDTTLNRSGSPTLVLAVGSYAITGSTAALESVVNIDSGDYNTTGTDATIRDGFGIVALVGSYAITNPAVANFRRTHRFTASETIYSIAGQAATLLEFSAGNAWQIAAEGSFYTYTGQSAGLGNAIVAGEGTYTINSVGAGLYTPYVSGAYSITGTAAAFVHNRRIIAVAGVYTITGQIAILLTPTESLIAESGAYVIAGQATLLADRLLVCNIGIYSHVGTAVFLRVPRIIIESGEYFLSGSAQFVNLSTSQSVRWKQQPVVLSAAQRQALAITTWDTQPEEPGIVTTTIQP
jgi:hypothetical protein